MKVFVSPCGTSLLTNQANIPLTNQTNRKDSTIRDLLMRTANYKLEDFNADEKEIVDKHIQERGKKILEEYTIQDIKKISAELNGILTFYEGKIPSGKGVPDQHYLLVSDTYQGGKVGEIIVNWLKKQELYAQVIKIPDLATNKRDAFRLAMSELIKWCKDNLEGYRSQGWEVIFNLTGGFKSVQGFLQAIGMFYADRCIYIFQFSQELLEIPRLPISLDIEGIIGQHLPVFRKFDLDLPVTKEECSGIPETLLFFTDDENQITLSEWGRFIWLEGKDRYYQKELLPSLSDKLVYSSEFEKTVKDLKNQKDRIELVNKTCDQLCRYLESNRNDNYNPPSLDFKELKGNPVPGSTHECDAWHDKDAKRLYCHYENDKILIIDRLGKKLPSKSKSI